MPDRPVGLKIKIARLERGVLQRRLSLLTGIRLATLSEIENSWRLPSVEQVNKIAAAIGVSPEELEGQP